MKFELSNPRILKTVIDTLSIITDESMITFTEDNILVNALSKDHITFMSIELDKTLFDMYDSGQSESVNVDVHQLNQILKRCKNTDYLTCDIDEHNITLIFNDDSTRKFNIRLIDESYESPQSPKIDYPINLTIPTTVLNESLGDLKIFSDIIYILIDQDYIKFMGDGQQGEAEIKYLHGEHIQKSSKSQYSIQKLTEIMKAKDFSEEIEIGIGDDLPIQITFKLITGDGKLEFLLAPRISEQ